MLRDIAACGWLAAWGALAGCGSVAAQRDAGSPETPVPDGSHGRCDPAAAFAPPLPIAVLDTSAVEFEGRLSPDELAIWFERSSDIFVADRHDIADNFGAPRALTEVNTASVEGGPTVTADGRTMYLYMQSGRAGDDLYLARRP